MKDTKNKYSPDNNSTSRWDFMEGFQQGVIPNQIVESSNEAAEITLTGRLPFVVLIPEESPTHDERLKILISNDDLLGEFEFQREVMKSNVSSIQMAIEDKKGELSFSYFNARIISSKARERPIHTRIKNTEEIDPSLIVELALILIRKFIASYRAVWQTEKLKYPKEIQGRFDKGWIPEVNIHNTSPWRNIQVFTKNGTSIYQLGEYDCRGTGVAIGTTLPEKALSDLQDFCINEVDWGISEYIAICNRLLSNQEYESLTILLSATLEKRIFILLRNKLTKEGKSDEDIFKELHTGKLRKDNNTHETISWTKALNKLLDGKQYKNEKSFIDIEKNLYQIRDEVIHGKPIRVQREQAQKAIDSLNNFLIFLPQY